MCCTYSPKKQYIKHNSTGNFTNKCNLPYSTSTLAPISTIEQRHLNKDIGLFQDNMRLL